MTIYFALILYLGFLVIILRPLKTKKTFHIYRILFTILMALGLFFVMALRDVSVGTDTYSYFLEYESAEEFINYNLRPTELGYSYFNFLVSKTGINYQGYLSIISAFFIIVVSLLFYQYSKNIPLSFFLHITIGLFAFSMSGIMQTLAIAIVFIAFLFLLRGRQLAFFILVAFATLIHNSALIFISVYFLRNIRLSKYQAILVFAISLSTFVTSRIVAPLIQTLINGLSLIQYFRYFNEINYINPVVIIVYIAIPLSCLFIWPKNRQGEHVEKILSISFVMACLNIVIYALSLRINLFERLSYYFILPIAILIPNIIQHIKTKNIQLIAKMASVFLPMAQFFISIPGNSIGIDKYRFFW